MTAENVHFLYSF